MITTVPALAAEADAPLATAPDAHVLAQAAAADPGAALAARLDALEARNRALEAQVEALTAKAQAPAPKADPAATKVTLGNGRPSIATNDGRFTASFRGVFQLDAAHYDQRAPGPLATDFRRGSYGDASEADRARDLGDGANFRRARFGLEGKAFGDWDYSFLYEFGGTGVENGGSINQAWLQYSGLKTAKLRVGAFAPPANLDDVTSTSGSLFLERSAVAEMVRGLAAADARTAAGVLASGERWTASAAVTGATVGQQSFDEQLGFVARASFVPVKTKDTLVHLGVNTSQILNPPASGPDVAPAGAVTNVRFRERPENRVDGTRLVDTGNIDADNASVWGLEAAAQHGKFHVQGEYFGMKAERRTGSLSDPKFAGWYVQAGWTLNGPARKYKADTGAFDAPKVEKPFNPKTGDWGVWEVGARYSELDLNHKAGARGLRARRRRGAGRQAGGADAGRQLGAEQHHPLPGPVPGRQGGPPVSGRHGLGRGRADPAGRGPGRSEPEDLDGAGPIRLLAF
ncbi:OprO/OprP family phosphate-selective porin [Phenylobacterium sp. J367]|uniref:OprO/OprP family phosphate-selective porin n=1 Tax=Phenylobacterium sp. J367 TaxID=2898435 RepID=UPI0021512181|nr:OprO/OprP family phosphate-selective porin [Phenylobacterium sp. J367]MCR5878088.1 OprO/OprP family phosphate-selective porin [Phenylobacterium sp. J367]